MKMKHKSREYTLDFESSEFDVINILIDGEHFFTISNKPAYEVNEGDKIIHNNKKFEVINRTDKHSGYTVLLTLKDLATNEWKRDVYFDGPTDKVIIMEET